MENKNPIRDMEVVHQLKENSHTQKGYGTNTPQGGGVELPKPAPVIKHSLSDIKHTKKGL